MRFQVLMTMSMMAVLWDIAQCSLIEVYWHSEVLTDSMNTVMMEAVSTSEKVVDFYKTIWCTIPEESSSCIKQFNQTYISLKLSRLISLECWCSF
jgi:hypothetical protein